MRLILSRKGFDTASGGVPSPIFADHRMLSLPIPDLKSKIQYGDITWNGMNVGGLVSELTEGRIPPTHRAHVDPDLVESSLPRMAAWKPIFGQSGASQGHLRNSDVQEGDIFLFYGLFRDVHEQQGRFRWVKESPARHVLWGWLQIGDVIRIDDCEPGKFDWARYHPHFHRGIEANNTLYISRTFLTLPGISTHPLPGAGIFPFFAHPLRLSARTSASPSIWELPTWFFPTGGRTPLTYHSDPSRWTRIGSIATLRSVARGQEFVLNCTEYPEAIVWIHELLEAHWVS